MSYMQNIFSAIKMTARQFTTTFTPAGKLNF